MSLDGVLLALLREPGSGYDLHGRLESQLPHAWTGELSQIYTCLRRLEQEGALQVAAVASRSGPPRRVHRRTPAGTRRLRDWVADGPELGKLREPHLAQVAALGELGTAAERAAFLERLTVALSERLDGLEDLEHRDFDGLPADFATPRFHAWLALRIALRTLRAQLLACEEALALVRERGPAAG
ncbi:MAG TPA: PadR family transcriptional regulator [Planctomycetota bacterium]